MLENWLQKQGSEQPLGLLDGIDVAYAAAFLLSNATRKVTGSVWTVDAGYTAH